MTKKSESKEVAVVEITKKKIGDPGVIAVGGVILEPVAKVSKGNTAVIHNGILLVENLGLLTLLNDSGELSIYEAHFKGKGRGESIDYFIVADDTSSLDMIQLDHQWGYKGPFTVITLINSSSEGDYFEGSSILSNIKSYENVFIDSIIEGTGYTHPPERVEVAAVEANLVKFRGRQLPPGYYFESTLHENTFAVGGIEPRATTNILSSVLSHNRFGEGEIEIEKSQVSMSSFLYTGKTTINGIALKDEYFSDIYPSVHLASAFDLTTIDISSQGKARMVRIDSDNVLITLPAFTPKYLSKGFSSKLLTMSFKNPEPRRFIRELASRQLFGNVEPSETEYSVLQYFVDTVCSRVKMINLLHTAQCLVTSSLLEVKDLDTQGAFGKGGKSVVGRNQFNWPITLPAFTNYREPVKDDDKTIYIDGDNFK